MGSAILPPDSQMLSGGFKERGIFGCGATENIPFEQRAAAGGERFAPFGAKQDVSTKNPRTLCGGVLGCGKKIARQNMSGDSVCYSAKSA